MSSTCHKIHHGASQYRDYCHGFAAYHTILDIRYVDVNLASLWFFDKIMSIEHATWAKKNLFNIYKLNIKISARPWLSTSGYRVHFVAAIFVASSGSLMKELMCMCRHAQTELYTVYIDFVDLDYIIGQNL